jgi:photosystem II stability/assembly factor-like uncharacterized protein
LHRDAGIVGGCDFNGIKLCWMESDSLTSGMEACEMMFRKCLLVAFISTLIGIGCLRTGFAQMHLDMLAGNAHIPETWLNDCALNDIEMLSADTGWAVGDHGLALFTRDGGQRWHKINLNTRCNLESIFFVDEFHGWITGGFALPYVDHTQGFIWRTTDGGANWSLVRHPALPWIKQIHFSTPMDGWCITISNHVNPSGFYTSFDGGQTWSSKVDENKAQWIAADQAGIKKILIGDRGTTGHGTSNKFEPGLFADGVTRALNCVCMVDQDTGFAAGPNGAIMRTRDGGVSWYPHEPDFDPVQRETFDYHTACLQAAPGHGNMLPGALPMPTRQSGPSGNAPPMPGTNMPSTNMPSTNMPSTNMPSTNMPGTNIHGAKVWFAGNPGSVLFQFDIDTKQWNRIITGINEPISKIEFYDLQRGWLITRLGTIMTTYDGGLSWHVQRRSADRAALMAIAGSADQLPLEMISKFCGDEQLVTTATIVDPQSSRFADSHWLAQNAAGPALTRLGVSYTVTIAPPVQKSDENNGAPDRSRMVLSKLVREIRTQRPTVIIVGGKPSIVNRPIDELVINAINAAGDPKAFPEQLERANLQPWFVDKLYRQTEQGNESASMSHRQFLTSLGMSVEDHVSISRGLLNLSVFGPTSTHLQLVHSHRPDGAREHQIFNEAAINQFGQARRQSELRARGSGVTYALVGRKTQSLEKLVRWDPSNPQMQAAWLGELSNATRGLATEVSGCWMYQLADLYMREGKPELAARTLTQLVRTNPNHPFTDASLLWLTNYFYSEEMAYAQARALEKRIARNDPIIDSNVRPASFSSEPVRLNNQSGSVLIWTPPSSALDKADDPRTQLAPDLDQDMTPVQRAQRLYSLRQRQGYNVWQALSNRSPHLPEVPPIKFASIVYKRKTEGPMVASFHAKNLANGHWDRYGFAGAALVERWLDDPKEPIGRVPALHCLRVSEHPFLDGKLDDAVWKTVTQQGYVQSLQSPQQLIEQIDVGDKTALFTAFDDEFLYIAIQCDKSPDVTYPKTAESRTHDAVMDRYDRVTVQLDTDRDYASAYALSVDSRGCVADLCGRDPSWNPKWFVASSQTDKQWTVEAAIPLEELISDPSKLSAPWAISVKRVIGAGKHQVWPLASLDDSAFSVSQTGLPLKGDVRPKEFGLLRFHFGESEENQPEK